METLKILKEAVSRFGSSPYLIEDKKSYSYSDVDRLSNSLAAGLKRLGVTKGDRIALYMNGASEFVIARLAVQKLGAAVVPLNTRLLPQEIDHILNDCAPKYVIGDAGLAGGLPEKWSTQVIAVGGDGAAGRYEELVGSGSDEDPGVDVTPDDTAMILYTSGTTGKAKGAVIMHKNSLASGQWMAEATALSGKDILLSCIPMFSASSMNGYLIASLLNGTPWVITEKFSPEEVLKKIEEKKVTVLHGTGAQHGLIASQPSYGERNLSSLRLLTWSNVLPLEMLRRMQSRLSGIQFIQFYGMTETSPIGTHVSTPAMMERPASCGKPTVGFSEIRVVDPGGRECPADTPGEILIRTPGLMREYFKNPAATREAVRDGWFHTGDLGKLDNDGFLYIVGRVKDVINRGGEKIFAPEVEQVLLSHPLVQDAAIVGIPHPIFGEEVKAFIVKKPGAEVDAEAIRAHCEGKLSPHKIPKDVEFRTELPKNAMGKTLKYLLKGGRGSS